MGPNGTKQGEGVQDRLEVVCRQRVEAGCHQVRLRMSALLTEILLIMLFLPQVLVRGHTGAVQKEAEEGREEVKG